MITPYSVWLVLGGEEPSHDSLVIWARAARKRGAHVGQLREAASAAVIARWSEEADMLMDALDAIGLFEDLQ